MSGENKKVDKKEQSNKEEEKTPPKFRFECTRCGACCQNRGPIPITFNDLARWTKSGSFMTIILPHIELGSISEEDELSKIALVPYIKMQDIDEQGLGVCPFYDKENKMCNIYFTMPINCKTFPLSFNGEKFYVSDPTCEGIGKGEMTKEKLLEMRDTAVREYNERADTAIAMVPLQGLFIKHFMKESQEKISKLSDEERDRLDELIKKSEEEEQKKE